MVSIQEMLENQIRKRAGLPINNKKIEKIDESKIGDFVKSIKKKFNLLNFVEKLKGKKYKKVVIAGLNKKK